jgi:hypothetical protein
VAFTRRPSAFPMPSGLALPASLLVPSRLASADLRVHERIHLQLTGAAHRLASTVSERGTGEPGVPPCP